MHIAICIHEEPIYLLLWDPYMSVGLEVAPEMGFTNYLDFLTELRLFLPAGDFARRTHQQQNQVLR